MVNFETILMTLRLENAIVSYLIYIAKMLWPHTLSIFYPYPDTIPLWRTTYALVVLGAITIAAIKTHTRHAYFLVGWLWYLGSLVPALGLVQAGLWPAMADRFVYIPLIGLFIVLVWGGAEFTINWCYRTRFLVCTASVLLIVLILTSFIHLRHWRDDITLFQHAVDVTQNNDIAHNNLGLAFLNIGDFSSAISHFAKALQINPSHFRAHNNWGITLAKQGKLKKALDHFHLALKINPAFRDAHNNIGFVYAIQKKFDKAIRWYELTLELDPLFIRARNNLAQALFMQGRIKEAAYHYSEVLRLTPYNNTARIKLRKLNELRK